LEIVVELYLLSNIAISLIQTVLIRSLDLSVSRDDFAVSRDDFCVSRDDLSVSLETNSPCGAPEEVFTSRSEPYDDLSVTILACRVTILAYRLKLISCLCGAPEEVFASKMSRLIVTSLKPSPRRQFTLLPTINLSQ
jgi:hypothetical protein